jgi:hypothetical protein
MKILGMKNYAAGKGLEVILMDWACDASQMGLKFLPHQENYKLPL